jgi:F-type H+-transporting ATPase subunit b
MQIINNIALISINETLIVQLISFLIFMFIMNRMMFQPLRGVMKARENRIDGLKSEIVDAEKEVDNLRSRIKDQETAVIRESLGIRQELEEAGSREASKIFSAVRAEIGLKRKRTQEEIDSRIVESRRQIKKESEALAIAIIEKMLDRRLA